MYQFRLHILLALADSTIRRSTVPFPSLLMPSPDMMFEWQMSISTSPDRGNGAMEGEKSLDRGTHSANRYQPNTVGFDGALAAE